MAGGIMQIVAVGAQNQFLTVDPDVTFFKVNHRKHTNFAIESIEQTFSGQVDFGKKATVTVSRNGDLMHKVYLQVDLPAMTQGSGTVAWTRNIGHTLIDEVSIDIGGQTIDKHYGDWMNIWNELTQTSEHWDGYNTMIGNVSYLTDTSSTTIPAETLYIPLQFWFCKNPGLALPIIALQYHEIKFNITFRSAAECYITDDNLAPSSGTPSLGNASLYIDYIYLDTEERRQFAQAKHEYLIEQLQFGGSESFSASTFKAKLNFNHPCKEIAWVIQYDDNVVGGANRWSDYTDSGTSTPDFYLGSDPLADAKLQLNGQDRFSTRKARYFNTVQPYQHHTRCPATGIYVYSFGLNPENFQPSGSVNMSRIDSAVLQLTTTASVDSKLRVYAVNNNILKIMGGMGGVSFSN
jgi:hypothetical protein